jgi:hypothetical protein
VDGGEREEREWGARVCGVLFLSSIQEWRGEKEGVGCHIGWRKILQCSHYWSLGTYGSVKIRCPLRV